MKVKDRFLLLLLRLQKPEASLEKKDDDDDDDDGMGMRIVGMEGESFGLIIIVHCGSS